MKIIHLFILLALFSILVSKFGLKNKKEILVPNNLDEVYGNNIQKEYNARSERKCIFRCTSPVSDQEVEKKYKEEINIFSENQYNKIKNIDMKYYCNSVKPLYVVYLTPDIETISDAQKLCNRDTKIYSLAEKYCTKNKDCSAPEIEIK